MASSCEKLDQLVKDYLLFRGFTGTLKMLDQELKTDKDKGLRVDRMMDYIWSLLAAYDLTGLRDYWRYLNQRLFSRLDQRYTQSVRKLESSLLKLYLVNAHQCGKQDKVRAFFEIMGPELQAHLDFKDWFAFPFVANPTENPAFSVYFNKHWQDTLQLSLHNFLSVVLQAMPVPTLLNVEFDARRMKNLQEENTQLKEKLRNSAPLTQPVKEFRAGSRHSLHSEFNRPPTQPDMVYDFSGLADECENPAQEKQKTTRRFPLSLTSPLSGRKKSDSSQIKAKVSAFNLPAAASTTTTASSTSLTTTAPKTKVTEMSTFPPTSSKIPSNGKKLPVVVTAISSHLQNPAKQTSPATAAGGTSLSPSPSRKLNPTPVSTAPVVIASEPLTQPTTARSFSVPGDKLIKTPVHKLPVRKQSTEGITDPSSSMAMKSGDLKKISVKEEGAHDEVDHDTSLSMDAETPFLTLEDEYLEHNSTVSYCHFGPTGQYVASLDMAGIVNESGRLAGGLLLLLGNKSGSIRLFDVKETKTHRELQMHPENPENCSRVNDICMNPSGDHFVCATSNLCPFTSNPSSVNGAVLLWDIKSWRVERCLFVNSDVCNAVTCSNFNLDGYLVTGGTDGFIRVHDYNQMKPVMKWRAHDNPIHTIQCHGKDSIYSMDSRGKLCEWSLTHSGQLVNSLSVGESQIQKFTSGRCRSQLFALDKKGQYLLTYRGHKGAIYQLQGKSSPECVMELKAHSQPVVTVDWSPSLDTQVCLTGSTDGKVKISALLSK